MHIARVCFLSERVLSPFETLPWRANVVVSMAAPFFSDHCRCYRLVFFFFKLPLCHVGRYRWMLALVISRYAVGSLTVVH